MLNPPKAKPKEPICLNTLVWSQNNLGVKADSTRYLYDENRRLSHGIRSRYLENGTVTKSSPIAPTRTFNPDGSPDLIIFPDNKNVIRYTYANNKLTKAELVENGQVVQTFTIKRDAQGRVHEVIGSGKLNNTRSVTTYNDKGNAITFDRYDQGGNRIFWNTYEDFDPAVTRPYLHSFPYEQGAIIIDLADFANFNTNVFGHGNANGPYRRGKFYSAVDEKGKYNGITKLVGDISVTFIANSQGFVKQRSLTSNNTSLQAKAYWYYADCD
jgi:hypothetical protein